MLPRTDANGWICVAWAVVFGVAGWCRGGEAERPDQATHANRQDDTRSLPSQWLDSALSWTDQFFFHQWRIQQHVVSKQCRLLDDDGETNATGTFEECLAKLETIKRERNIPPMHGKGVVLLHGLGAPCWSMQLLARHLHKEGGYEVFAVDYASTRSSIDDQARSLASVIKSLAGIEEINLVGHSMGNIVIRRYLAGDQTPSQGWCADPRIARIVMIAPPNHGSSTAARLSDNSLFKSVFGESGRQLGVNWEDLESRLATPDVEFGIIAGGCGNGLGLDPFLPGDDDGRITVETTRLAGATDFVVVPALHELIANDPRVFGYTLRFLTAGCFVSPEQKQGLPRAPSDERPPSEAVMIRQVDGRDREKPDMPLWRNLVPKWLQSP